MFARLLLAFVLTGCGGGGIILEPIPPSELDALQAPPAEPVGHAGRAAAQGAAQLYARARVGGFSQIVSEASDEFVGSRMTRHGVVLRGGGRYLIIAASSPGVDLDMVVRDENHGAVGQDQDATHLCAVEIAPRWTGPFAITLTAPRAGEPYHLAILRRP